MPLKIYNSLSKQKEEFRPLVPGQVKMYVCGPTVYDEPHIGHLRSAYCFDVMRRYLEFSGYKVNFVRNVTDVDDKIIEKARETGATDLIQGVNDISKKYYEAYVDALKKLGVTPPTREPFATGHIPEMIALIERLISKGSAYESAGDVYFNVQSFVDYGKLSHQKKDSMLEGVRIDASEKKKSPLDFALWKKSKEGEPSWPSPWGHGRPGWHIECSAMSTKYLGETFDIHGGGLDLIFPHHENEIAQSECATGKTFARLWVHHGLITINHQKMSKSLRNFVTLNDIQKKSVWGIEELKLLFIGTHYTSPLDYSESHMSQAKAVRNRFVEFYSELAHFSDVKPAAKDARFEESLAKFKSAMDDDFNTPGAVAMMHEMVDRARESKSKEIMLGVGMELRSLSEALFGITFGVDIQGGKITVRHAATSDVKSLSSIEGLVKKREEAKKKRDFGAADQIRKELTQQGVMLKDLPDGTTEWRVL